MSQKEINICILTTAFPRWIGDTRAPFIYNFAKAFAKKGYKTKVVAMHNPGALEFEVMDGIEVYRPCYAPNSVEILQEQSGGLPVTWKRKPWARLLLFPFLVAYTIRALNVSSKSDIIHANWTLAAMVALLIGFVNSCPFLVTVQGSDIFQGLKIPLVKILTKWTLKKARYVIALSTALAHEVQKIGVDPKKIKIIPNGVDIVQFSYGPSSNRRKIILFVGSLIQRKGGDYLIHAFSMVSRIYHDYKLVFIGEGDKLIEWRNLATSLNLEDKVEFIGVLGQDDISHWMKKAKLFVLPSVEEGQGVVLVEALACGTPCIGSNVGGIPDVITQDVGLIVPPKDATKLSEAISKLISNDPLWEIMSKNARKRAENTYSWDQIIEIIDPIYLSLIGNHK